MGTNRIRRRVNAPRALVYRALLDADAIAERGEEPHVISLREATKHEARYYFKAISDET